jgi:hypothetical protein
MHSADQAMAACVYHASSTNQFDIFDITFIRLVFVRQVVNSLCELVYLFACCSHPLVVAVA